MELSFLKFFSLFCFQTECKAIANQVKNNSTKLPYNIMARLARRGKLSITFSQHSKIKSDFVIHSLSQKLL